MHLWVSLLCHGLLFVSNLPVVVLVHAGTRMLQHRHYWMIARSVLTLSMPASGSATTRYGLLGERRRHGGAFSIRSRVSKLNMAGSERETQQFISRHDGENNLVAAWQSKGDHYLRSDMLQKLNKMMSGNQFLNRKDDERLFEDMRLTYFARFHNLMRQEYQHEKSLVEERVRTWPRHRLETEGYALFDMMGKPNGDLYKDKVFRFFRKSGNHSNAYATLPHSRFASGDTVRITRCNSGNARRAQANVNINGDEIQGIQGIVLARRQKYIDICVPYNEMSFIQSVGHTYRLDEFVNRVSYERMMDALQRFVSKVSKKGDKAPQVAPAIRDLIMYSYPNSMINIARSAGGLRLALPSLMVQPPDFTADTMEVAAGTRSDASRVNFESAMTQLTQRMSFEYDSSVAEVVSSWVDPPMAPPPLYGSNKKIMTVEDMAAMIDEQPQVPAERKGKRYLVRSMNDPSYVDIDEPDPTEVFSNGKTVNDVMKAAKHPKPNSAALLSSLELAPVFSNNSRLMKVARHPVGGPILPSEVDHTLNQLLAKFPHLTLNPSQRGAVQHAISKPLSLIQGPPGTGKTFTACALLATLTRLRHDGAIASPDKHRMLACAHSNVAADNLLDGLVKLGLNVVRLGRPVNVQSTLWNHTLDALLQREDMWLRAKANLEEQERVLEEIRSNAAISDTGSGNSDQWNQEVSLQKSVIGKYLRRLEEVEERCIEYILNRADIVVSTCIGAGSDTLRDFMGKHNLFFKTVLVDEAAQCIEAAVWPALTMGCERLVLVGDQNQLPPVVVDREAQSKGLGVSLFSRLVAGGLVPHLLNEQYRMHPSIARFSSDSFYNGAILSRTSKADRQPPAGFPWPNIDVPIAFVDMSPKALQRALIDKHIDTDRDIGPNGIKTVDGYELLSNSSQTSYFNAAEVEAVVAIVQSLLHAAKDMAATATNGYVGLKPIANLSHIGVISPYNAQVQELTSRFREEGWGAAFAQHHPSNRTGSNSNNTNGSRQQMGSKLGTAAVSPAVAQGLAKMREQMQSKLWHRCEQSPSVDVLSVSDATVDDNDSTVVKQVSAGPQSVEAETTQTDDEESDDFIEVKSVDGFQGREKELIIISPVRSNPDRQVGFLKDWRRLNVAVTRAKAGLIVVGDMATLDGDVHWGAFIDYCKSNRLVVSLSDGVEMQHMERYYQSILSQQTWHRDRRDATATNKTEKGPNAYKSNRGSQKKPNPSQKAQ